MMLTYMYIYIYIVIAYYSRYIQFSYSYLYVFYNKKFTNLFLRVNKEYYLLVYIFEFI